MNRKEQFESDIDRYIKNDNVSMCWSEYLDLVIKMELAAWENGKPYVPSDLARKYDTHNKLNIYTYFATHLKVLTKHFEYEKLSQHFSSLTNEWLGKLDLCQ